MYYFQVLRKIVEQVFKKENIQTEHTEFMLENFNIIFNIFNACLIYYNESTQESVIHQDYTEVTKSLLCICTHHIFDILNHDIIALYRIDDRFMHVKELCHIFPKEIPQNLPINWIAEDFQETYLPGAELSTTSLKNIISNGGMKNGIACFELLQ